MENERMNRGGSVFLIKVYSYEGKNINGIVYDVSSNVRYEYSNMTQLLLRIEELLEQGSDKELQKNEIFERARHESRFEMVAGSKPWIFDKMRVAATFRLQILFRKYGTWQGVLSSVDSESRNAFRSILEMTMMMDSELQAAAAHAEAEVCQ